MHTSCHPAYEVNFFICIFEVFVFEVYSCEKCIFIIFALCYVNFCTTSLFELNVVICMIKNTFPS